jgi:hypothetical protein
MQNILAGEPQSIFADEPLRGSFLAGEPPALQLRQIFSKNFHKKIWLFHKKCRTLLRKKYTN